MKAIRIIGVCVCLCGLVVTALWVTFKIVSRGGDEDFTVSLMLGVDKDRLRETIIADQPSLANETAIVEKKIQETLAGCDARIVQVIRRRVKGLGINDPAIQVMMDHRFLVQMPGVDDEMRQTVKSSLQSAAFLEFRLTHPRNDELVNKLLSQDVAPEGYQKGGSGYQRAANYNEVSSKKGYAARLAAFHTPDPRYQFMLEKTGDGSYRPAFVACSSPTGTSKRFTGEFLTSASVERDPAGSLAISFSLNSEGARLFSQITRNYVAHGPKNPTDRGRQLAVILDDMLVSAPVLQSEIGAHGQITGHFTAPEAQQLANNLNAGALPAPLQVIAESAVAPRGKKPSFFKGLLRKILLRHGE